MNRVAVFYHYFEKNQNYRENLIFFISTAILDEVDYFFVMSGKCSVDIPKLKNVFSINTENKNNDYGGYATALKDARFQLDNYDIIAFINSSVRGPFYAPKDESTWIDVYINQLQNGVKLVGSSIHLLGKSSPYFEMCNEYYGFKSFYPHVQTTSYVLTRDALQYLIDEGFYHSESPMSKSEVIAKYEVGLSQIILNNEWNISCLLPQYQDVNYQDLTSDINPFSWNGDPVAWKAYFGRTPTPEDVIFIKSDKIYYYKSALYFRTFLHLFWSASTKFKEWKESSRLQAVSLAKMILFLPRDLYAWIVYRKKGFDRLLKRFK